MAQRILSVIVTLLVAAACSANRGAVKPQASEGPYTVSVFPEGPPTWTYTVSTSTNDGIVAFEIVTSADLRKCTLTPATRQLEFVAPKQTDQGIQVRLTGPSYRQVAVGLQCKDHVSGPVHLVVRNGAGIQKIIGPVPGPVKPLE